MFATPTVRTFVPESWSTVKKFQHFYAGTHTFDSTTTRALNGVSSHLNKAVTLYNLAEKLSPNLEIDNNELKNKGYTSAINTSEFTAVTEEIFTELYSSIDCTRKVIVKIYSKTRGLKDSTSGLFQRIRDDKLGTDFPEQLKIEFKTAKWQPELKAIRDELTHTDIGHCSIDRETKIIGYSHHGISFQGRPLHYPNILEKLKTLITEVNNFLSKVFDFLNSQLNHYETTVLCGLLSGKGLARKITLEREFTFHSGTCISHVWFDNEDSERCPFAQNCGAYNRALNQLPEHDR